jgi:tetratricopeptide (TPR) repeat protein
MPIDRAGTLRSAEKLLRQGKLDLAIAEYLRVVEAQPRDWNTANLLGDLYMRTGQSDKAVEQYVRIADSLKEQGFLSKAGALYKKVLKINPDDEHTLLQWADVAASQGLLADALESVGETASALAICLELQADAGSYRDLPARIERLSKVQTKG